MVQAIQQAFVKADPCLLQLVMTVEMEVPNEFQNTAIAEENHRRALITSNDADVPLQNTLGFSMDLRSSAQDTEEFTMEYKVHDVVTRDVQEELMGDRSSRKS
jgi:elongation factor G